jgi:hypothetical protein
LAGYFNRQPGSGADYVRSPALSVQRHGETRILRYEPAAANRP